MIDGVLSYQASGGGGNRDGMATTFGPTKRERASIGISGNVLTLAFSGSYLVVLTSFSFCCGLRWCFLGCFAGPSTETLPAQRVYMFSQVSLNSLAKDQPT